MTGCDNNNEGATPLIKAAQKGHREVVDFLLSAGACRNHLTTKKLSPTGEQGS